MFALLLCATSILVGHIGDAAPPIDLRDPDLLGRLCLLASLPFLYGPQVEDSGIALAHDKSRFGGPFMMHAVKMGWFFGLGFVLMQWPGLTKPQVQVPILMASSAVFGLLMAYLQTRQGSSDRARLLARRAFFEGDAFADASSWRVKLYYLWPAIAAVLVALVLLSDVLNGLTIGPAFAVVVLLGLANGFRRPPKSFQPLFVGLGLLLAGTVTLY